MDNPSNFNYQRADYFSEPNEPPLIKIFESFGQLKAIESSPNWQKHRLYKIYNEAQPFLSDLLARANSVSKLELGDFNDSAKERRRRDHLRGPYISLLELVQKERSSSRQAIKNLESHAMRISDPTPPDDIADRISFDSKMQEIRSLLRNQDTQKRIETINENLEVNNPAFLHSAISSPDEIIPKNRLNEIRMNFAFTHTPTLKNAINDAQELAEAIEQRTGQLSGTATAILASKDLEIPTSKLEYFQFFPAKTEREQQLQNRFIETENHIARQRETFQESQLSGSGL